jgi:competence protein ComEC
LPFFRRHGVSRLAVAVVTHGDADHLGGIPAVVEELEPKLVLDPGQPIGTNLYLEYLRSLDVAGAEWRAARAGDSFVIDSVQFEVLHPSSDWIAHEISPNENSVVMRVTYRCFRALLTGDIGRSGLCSRAISVGLPSQFSRGRSARRTCSRLLTTVPPVRQTIFGWTP